MNTSTKIAPKKAELLGFVKLSKPKPSPAFATYWKFAEARQNAYLNRIKGSEGPWSDDPILAKHKFTNCYRASDRVSQYLIRNVIYSKKWSLKDTVFRVLLFKIFNKIETWELLESQVGEICANRFNVQDFANILNYALEARGTIYSAAYIMPSGPKAEYLGVRKHVFHLKLLEKLLKDQFPTHIHSQKSMSAAFSALKEIDSFGNFLAYQLVTDLNYSDWFNFSESEFVMPGPGAIDGIAKCFTSLGDYNQQDVIKMMMDEQDRHFEAYDCNFTTLGGRPLQLIDCQNLFCEVDKYSRVAHPEITGKSGRTKIKQLFKPKSMSLSAWFPPKWGINEEMSKIILPPSSINRLKLDAAQISI